MSDTLVLNAGGDPIRVLPWQRAIILVLEEKAYIKQGYDRLVRSASLSFPMPAVIELTRYVWFQHTVKFNRSNVLARDAYTCQYCGVRPRRKDGLPKRSDLTLDHVIPRAQSIDGHVRTSSGVLVAVTCWKNILTACYSCNNVKAARTPAEAGMVMLSKPRRPNGYDVLRMALVRTEVPQEWKNHLPQTSEWADYWDVELDAD